MEKRELAAPSSPVRRRPRRLPAGLVIVVTLIGVPAAAAPTTYHSKKVFRELIVEGERPEIAACMVAAVNQSRHHAKFDAIRWADDVSDTAYMRETEGGIHITRTVRFKAELRERQGRLSLDTWKPAEIVCEQRDEESPEVRSSPVGP
jgi:hypothetical protein